VYWPFRLESHVCLPSPLESYARLVGPLFGSESVRLVCSPSPFYPGGVLQRIGFETDPAVTQRVGFETDPVVAQRGEFETERVVSQSIRMEAQGVLAHPDFSPGFTRTTLIGGLGPSSTLTIMISELSSAGCIGSMWVWSWSKLCSVEFCCCESG
jgi:hypothetical protein